MSYNFFHFKKTLSLFVPRELFKNKKTRFRLLLSLSLILVDIASVSLVPYFSKRAVDQLSLQIFETIWLTIGFLGFFWIVEKTITHAQEILFFPIINNTIRNLTYKVVQHIHQIPLSHYQQLSIPEVINCIRRISYSARAFIKIIFLMFIPSLVKLSIAIIIAIKIGTFGALLIPVVFLSLFLLYKGTLWYTQTREEAWQVSDRVTMRLSDSILNTKLCRFFQPYEMEKLGTLLDQEAKLWKRSNTRLHSIYIAIGTLLGITFTLTLAGVVINIQNHSLTVGDFVLLKGQLIAAFLPLRTFSIEFRQLTESLIDIKKIIQLLDLPVEKNQPLTQMSPACSNTLFEIRRLSFLYENNIIFKNISLSIFKGQKIAIVGKSGSGKSTLLNLMGALYQPESGEIFLEGCDLRTLTKTALQQKIYYIPQDHRLFNMSLRANLTYGLTSISDAQLLAAVKQVELCELVEALPHGLETMVGEMGTKLSGGEKQKVALARALLLKPDILLLDETTNSLNPRAEETILKILFSHIPTVVLTSHRISPVQYVDRIFKIENKQLIEISTPSPADHPRGSANYAHDYFQPYSA